MLPCMSCYPREEFLELLLVKVDDQVLNDNGFSILTVTLWHHLLVAEGLKSPAESPSCFSLKNLIGENLQKELRSKITSNSLKKITGRSPLRFLEKYAGRNLISARSLYSFNDAIGQVVKLPS